MKKPNLIYMDNKIWKKDKTAIKLFENLETFSLEKMLSFVLCEILWWEVFMREPEKTFSTYSGP